MLSGTRGIVLRTIKYSDNSLIAKIYTEGYGLQSYLVQGARSKKNRKINFLQPLTLLDLKVSYRQKSDLQRISEISCPVPFEDIPFDPEKTSVLLFLDEVLFRTIHEEEANRQLFDFIWDSMIVFDHLRDGKNNFHLWFLAALTKFLGFFPRGKYSPETPVFDLTEGSFVSSVRGFSAHLGEESSRLFQKILDLSPSSLHSAKFTAVEKKSGLESLILFYENHIPGFDNVRSLDVLASIFHN